MSPLDAFTDYAQTVPDRHLQVVGVRRRPDGPDCELHVLTVRVTPSDKQPAPVAVEQPPLMLLDWDEAARRIHQRQPKLVQVNLKSQINALAVEVYYGGHILPEESAEYRISCRWRPPVIVLDGVEEECWCFADERPDWTPTTYWPPSARQLLVSEPVSSMGTTT